MTDLQTYNQPTKVAVRKASLTHAVELLTSRREAAAVVPEDHVRRIRASLLESDTYGDANAARQCSDADIESWQRFRAQAVGTREPSEITVAYFAGPEPSNDLLTLLDLGLRPENIWAFEVEASAIASGLNDLEKLRLRGVKFIPVSIEQYFVGTPRRFDIIYIDACAPLPSYGQRTTRLIADIFRSSALSPLGVLITNFAKPDISQQNELNRYSHLVASYLYPKGFIESESGGMIEGPPVYGFVLPCDSEDQSDGSAEDDCDQCFLEEVASNFERYYGSFITRHVMDIAAIIAPMMRFVGSGLHKVLFDGSPLAAAERARRFVRFNPLFLSDDYDPNADDDLDLDGDAASDPSFFSLLWALDNCGLYESEQNSATPDADTRKLEHRWVNQLAGSQPSGLKPEEAIAAFYTLRHDKAFWSPAMRKIADFPYRAKMPFLCDVPTEEIGFYPAFAQLAYPAHANVREAKRFRYIAEGKTTEMFTDVLPFDECRYVFDWLSALHLVPEDWSDLSAQLTFRFALDAIVKNGRWFWDDFLYGCHVVGISSAFPAGELEPRINFSKEPGGRAEAGHEKPED